MEIKIIKRIKLREVNCAMCHNYYYGFKGRIYNDDQTKYKRFAFVVWFDVFDLQEAYESEDICNEDILAYANELADYKFSLIKSYVDCKEFYEECNRTIEEYNNSNNQH